MSPRASAAAAAHTRSEIVAETVSRGSVEGLEGVTIGELAVRLGMSKAGVIGPFGSKEGLQLAALEEAVAIFRHRVWEPATTRPHGIERLAAVGEAWIAFLEGEVFPGGCMLTAAAAEFNGRPGRVREAVDQALALWAAALEHEARIAIEAGDLPPGADAAQIAFELGGIAMAVNQAIQLRGDARAAERGRQALGRVLGRGGRS